jgi:hypothetical protein
VFAGLIEDYPTSLFGLHGSFSVWVAHEFIEIAFWADQAVSCFTITIYVIAGDVEIEMIDNRRVI